MKNITHRFGGIAIADQLYVRENGKIALQSTGEELLNNEHVRTAYLGV